MKTKKSTAPKKPQTGKANRKVRSSGLVLPRSAVQRLEDWMGEVTSLLLYQPTIPLDHKHTLARAMTRFSQEILSLDAKRQNK